MLVKMRNKILRSFYTMICEEPMSVNMSVSFYWDMQGVDDEPYQH
jgi:hypothetical protein